MKASLLKYWERVRSSFWFLPSLMAGAAAALAFTTIALDEALTDEWLQALGWAYTGGAEGASLLLSTIAGSMITIAGVVFSLTLVALSLASSQFGPRMLRNFMRDTANQLVLGTFVATFLYCLLVLRTIRHAAEDLFVPHLSVSVGVLFALTSVGVLIYFIHHVSVSIQADEIVARIGRELFEGIDRLFPRRIDEAEPAAFDTELPASFEREAEAVAAACDGYLQLIDTDALMHLARHEDLLIRVERRPGHYLVMGSALALVWPAHRLTESLATRINAAFVLGDQRTPAQDVEFSVSQLVEIAVRALSPGVNDPFTAIACVNRLGSALHRLAQRKMPSPFLRDAEARMRLRMPAAAFPPIADSAFNQIRQYAQTSAAVSMALLETLAVIAAVASRAEDRAALRRHADMIARGAGKDLPEEEDRRAMQARHQAVCEVLREFGASRP